MQSPSAIHALGILLNVYRPSLPDYCPIWTVWSGQSAYSSRTLIWQTPSQTRAATFRGEVQRFRGQAVIADQFHNHAGGQGNGKIDDQSHATGAAGIGPALLGADPFGNGVPIPSREGSEAVPHARGTNPGAPKGNSNARKHGGRSARAMAAARYLREIARLVREI